MSEQLRSLCKSVQVFCLDFVFFFLIYAFNKKLLSIEYYFYAKKKKILDSVHRVEKDNQVPCLFGRDGYCTKNTEIEIHYKIHNNNLKL